MKTEERRKKKWEKVGEMEMEWWGKVIEITAIGSSFKSNNDNRK